MNENPGEMPNPLNPNNNPLDANPAESQPLEEIVEEVQTVSVTPTGESSTDPMARPMEQAPVVEPVQPKKKKTGLIVAGVIAAVLAIGCGVAAAIILTMNGGDPVAKAIEKIASGKMPGYAEINGKITVTPNDEESIVSSVEVDLDSKTATTSMLNNTKATVTTKFANGDGVDLNVEEIYGADGDLYLKLENVASAIEGFSEAMNSNTNAENTSGCFESEEGETICPIESEQTTNCDADGTNCLSYDDVELGEPGLTDVLGGFGGIIEVIDGQWLRISVDDLNGLSESGITSSDNGLTCVTGVLSNYKNYSNSVVEAYSKNPFISSTTEGVTIASKTGQPVRKVVFDSEKLTGFSASMKDSAFVKDLQACSDEGATVETDTDGSFENMPTFYVEVDGDFNFTRVTFDAPVMDTSSCKCLEVEDCDCEGEETARINVDLSLSYPDTINVAEPTEYKDLSTMLQELFTMMYSNQGAQTDNISL